MDGEQRYGVITKMGATKQISFEIQKGKRLCFGFGKKWRERCVQCLGWRKIVLNLERKFIFSRQCKNKQRESLSHYMKEHDTYDIPLYMTSSSTLKPDPGKRDLNIISCEMEIDTKRSSSLLSEKQFYELPNARWAIQRLRTYSGEIILPKAVANLYIKSKGKIVQFKSVGCTRIGT